VPDLKGGDIGEDVRHRYRGWGLRLFAVPYAGARTCPADLSGPTAPELPAVGNTPDRAEGHGSLPTAKED